MDDPSAGIADALNHLGRDLSPDNWRRVVEGAWPLVAGPCFRIADQRGEDAVQEALLHVRAGARRFQPRSSDPDGDARRWLRRVATTSALAVLRTDRRSRVRSTHAAPPSAPPAPDQATALADDLAVMREELSALREPDRTAVALHHLQGQDVDEVARTLGCTPEAARKRIARALESLRARLSGRGVVLGLAAIATALREAPAATVPAAPTAASLNLISSSLAPATSIALGTSGVLIMATTTGCCAAILSTALIWSHVTGVEQTAAPAEARPRPTAAVGTAALHWLDQALPARERIPTLGEMPGLIRAATGHPVRCRMAWFAPGQRQAEPFALAASTPRAALDQLATSLDAAWMVVQEQIVIDTPQRIAVLQKPIDPPAGTVDRGKLIGHLRQVTGAKVMIQDLVINSQRPPIFLSTWTRRLPTCEALSILAQANRWEWTTHPDGTLFGSLTYDGPTPLLWKDEDPDQLVIRGQPWAARWNPLETCVDLDFEDAPVTAVIDDLVRQTGLRLTWQAKPMILSFHLKQMKCYHVLKYISEI